MKNMWRKPWFWLGVVLRVALVWWVHPVAVSQWYAPFLNTSVSQWTLDPWGLWLSQGGDPAAFPYGYTMWLWFLPGVLFASWMHISIETAYMGGLLCADVLMLVLVERMMPLKERFFSFLYWFCPVTLVSCYVLGFNDTIPVFLMLYAVKYLQEEKFFNSGILCCMSVFAKSSMVLVLPFFMMYFFKNKNIRVKSIFFIKGCAVSSVCLGIPFVASTSALDMLLSNPEIKKLYALSWHVTDRTSVYVVPVLYVLNLYFLMHFRRMDNTMFKAMVGVTFLALVLLVPAAPGWFVWCIPFLMVYPTQRMVVKYGLFVAFSMLYCMSVLQTPWMFWQNTVWVSVIYSGMVACGVLMCFFIFREAVYKNTFFRSSKSPFVVGVAGDSGAGKDTFVDAMTSLFGSHSSTKLSGDDYHLWDRHKPMWKVMTHLNPMANDLEHFSKDVLKLVSGKHVYCKHYDHTKGQMTKPVKVESKDFIWVSGLHALYLPVVRECCDIKIYLDMDERIRRFYKIKRDVNERGHSLEKVLKSIESRKKDADMFVLPQKKYADIVFSLKPASSFEETMDEKKLQTCLMVQTKHAFNELSMRRVLLSVCEVDVDIVSHAYDYEITMVLGGCVSSEKYADAARMLCPDMLPFLDSEHEWKKGVLGMMQLITLSHVHQILNRRFA
jgi:uridine kinase